MYKIWSKIKLEKEPNKTRTWWATIPRAKWVEYFTNLDSCRWEQVYTNYSWKALKHKIPKIHWIRNITLNVQKHANHVPILYQRPEAVQHRVQRWTWDLLARQQCSPLHHNVALIISYSHYNSNIAFINATEMSFFQIFCVIAIFSRAFFFTFDS